MASPYKNKLIEFRCHISTKLAEAQHTTAKCRDHMRENIHMYIHTHTYTYIHIKRMNSKHPCKYPKNFKVQSYFQKVRIYQERLKIVKVQLHLRRISTYRAEFNPLWLKPITKPIWKIVEHENKKIKVWTCPGKKS